jgi:hypothetical protein
LIDPESSRSIDERLASIVESIRTWDWHSGAFVEDGAARTALRADPPAPVPPAITTLSMVAPNLIAEPVPISVPDPPAAFTPPLAVDGDSDSQTLEAYFPAADAEIVDAEIVEAYFPTGDTDGEADIVEAEIVESDTQTVELPCPDAPGSPGLVVDPVATSPEQESAPPERKPGRRAKVIVWLVAAVIVVVVVAVLRARGPGLPSGSLTPVTVKSGAHSVLKPVSQTVLTQFNVASERLNTANDNITQALAASNGASVAQVTREVTPYATALSDFDYTVHFIAWPGTMRAPVQELGLRTQALISFLGSVSSQGPATLNSWFGQLYALGNEAQTADNLVRLDVGMPTTSSYP